VIDLANDIDKLSLPLAKNNYSFSKDGVSLAVVLKDHASSEKPNDESTKKIRDEVAPQQLNSIPQASGYIKYPAYDFF
jgi:hypothetical protein